MLMSCLFDKSYNSVHDILVDYILDVVLGPVEGKEAHSFYGCIVMGVSSGAVYDVGDLVER